uniref:Interferon alpha inducible protein 6 n=1 Tax=Ornithorhynchus anatinus TaxID=9258 RepID=A0A6I8NZ89_ORNAN
MTWIPQSCELLEGRDRVYPLPSPAPFPDPDPQSKCFVVVGMVVVWWNLFEPVAGTDRSPIGIPEPPSPDPLPPRGLEFQARLAPGLSLDLPSVSGLLALAAPAGLTALGFTSLGITAKSLAASLMSWSAVANGGGVASGGLVATLQSLGTQLSTTTLTSVGAKLGYSYHQNYVCGQKKKKK